MGKKKYTTKQVIVKQREIQVLCWHGNAITESVIQGVCFKLRVFSKMDVITSS